jgi:hypothetical protein
MRVAVFTSNQPRHRALIESLAAVADEVWAVQECTTLFPGRVGDFYKKSEVMQRYFAQVMAAEAKVFGGVKFLPGNVRSLPMRMADLNMVDIEALRPAIEADVCVVFGATYIKGALCERLLQRRAVNIHMGVSPWYRGSSCNFWAMYDRRPEMVGATLHLLSAGLDSGPMLRHALPPAASVDGFELGMLAVKAAHGALVEMIAGGSIDGTPVVEQDRSQQVRYTRNADFDDAVAGEYLQNMMTAEQIGQALAKRDLGVYLRPYVG